MNLQSNKKDHLPQGGSVATSEIVLLVRDECICLLNGNVRPGTFSAGLFNSAMTTPKNGHKADVGQYVKRTDYVAQECSINRPWGQVRRGHDKNVELLSPANLC